MSRRDHLPRRRPRGDLVAVALTEPHEPADDPPDPDDGPGEPPDPSCFSLRFDL